MVVEIRGEGENIKKDTHNVMCINSTEENENMNKSTKNNAKKAVFKAIRDNAQ